MHAIVVDWSGRHSGESRYIWLGEAVDGSLRRIESGRSRSEVVDELVRIIDRHDTDESLLIGLDFSFSFPSWFVVQQQCADVFELWDVARAKGEQWLAECPHPFWGKAGSGVEPEGERPIKRWVGKPTKVEMLRRCESALRPIGGITPKSTFQIGGAGSVGTGSIRGMPYLPALRAAGAAIWPFDPPSAVTICETYPRVLTGPVVKSSAEARRTYLSEHGLSIPTAVLSEDAFDAAVGAIELSLRAGPPVMALDDVTRLEGLIYPTA
jgi:hypothetical protein